MLSLSPSLAPSRSLALSPFNHKLNSTVPPIVHRAGFTTGVTTMYAPSNFLACAANIFASSCLISSLLMMTCSSAASFSDGLVCGVGLRAVYIYIYIFIYIYTPLHLFLTAWCGIWGWRSAESLTTRRFDPPLLLITPPYIAHCMGACRAKGEWSLFSLLSVCVCS